MITLWFWKFRPTFSGLACFCLALLAVSCTTVQTPPPAEVAPLPPAPYTKGTVKGRFLSTGSLVLGSPDGEKALRSLF